MVTQKKFSHVQNFTDYMKISIDLVNDFFDNDLKNKKILDIPAGNGLVSDKLKHYGANVISADINNEFPQYIP